MGGLRADRTVPARLASLAGVLVYLFWVACAAYVVMFRDSLPDKFTRDSQLIQRIAQSREGAGPDDSYSNTGLFFRFLGLAERPAIVALLGLFLCAFTVLLAWHSAVGRSDQHGDSVNGARVYASSAAIGFGSVFLTLYSKDVMVLVITILAIYLCREPNARLRWILLAIGIIAYGLTIRPYWILILMVFLGLRIASRAFLAKSPRALVVQSVLFAQIALIAATVASPLLLGEPADWARLMANENRIGDADARSAITRIIPSETALAVYTNLALTWIFLIAPVPLLLSSVAEHKVYAIAITGLWVSAAACSPFRDVNFIPQCSYRDDSRVIAFQLILAVLTIQALFEPDYGSYLRHLTPIIPLLMLVVGRPSEGLSPRRDNRQQSAA